MTEAYTVEEIPLSLIDPDPNQPRQLFIDERIDDLAVSLVQAGQLSEITLYPQGGRFRLIAGECRWRAAGKLEWETIRSRVLGEKPSDIVIRKMQLAENSGRNDLNCVEYAEKFLELRGAGCTLEEISAVSNGKNIDAISRMILLLDLPEPVKEALRHGDITESHGRYLRNLKTEEQQLAAFSRVIEDGLTVKQTERLVNSMLSTGKKKRGRPSKKVVLKNFHGADVVMGEKGMTAKWKKPQTLDQQATFHEAIARKLRESQPEPAVA